MYNKSDPFSDLNTTDLCEKQFQIQWDLLRENYTVLEELISSFGKALNDIKNTNYMFVKSSFDWYKASRVEVDQRDRQIEDLKLQLQQHNCTQSRSSLVPPDKQWESNRRWNQEKNYFGERSGRGDNKRPNYHYAHDPKSDNRGFSERNPRWVPDRRKSYNERTESCRNPERWNPQSNREARYSDRLYLIDNHSVRKEYVDSADSGDNDVETKNERIRKRYISMEDYKNKTIKPSHKDTHNNDELPAECSKTSISPIAAVGNEENPSDCLAASTSSIGAKGNNSAPENSAYHTTTTNSEEEFSNKTTWNKNPEHPTLEKTETIVKKTSLDYEKQKTKNDKHKKNEDRSKEKKSDDRSKLSDPKIQKESKKTEEKLNSTTSSKDDKLKKYRIPKNSSEIADVSTKSRSKYDNIELIKNYKSSIERKGWKTKLNFSTNETKEKNSSKNNEKKVETITKCQTNLECLVVQSDANNKNDEQLKESLSQNVPNTNIKITEPPQNVKNTPIKSYINRKDTTQQKSDKFLEINSPLKAAVKSTEDNSENIINAIIQEKIIDMQATECLENIKTNSAKTRDRQSNEPIKKTETNAKKSLKKENKRKGRRSKEDSTKKVTVKKRRNTIYDDSEEDGQEHKDNQSNLRVLRSATKQAQASKNKEEDERSPNPMESTSTVNLSSCGDIPVLHLSENEESVCVSTNILEQDLHLSFDQSNEEITSPDTEKNKTQSTPSCSSTNISDSNLSHSPARKRRRVIFSMID